MRAGTKWFDSTLLGQNIIWINGGISEQKYNNILDKTGNTFKFTMWSKVLKLVSKNKRVGNALGERRTSLRWRKGIEMHRSLTGTPEARSEERVRYRRSHEISSDPALGICPKFLEQGGCEKQKEPLARGSVWEDALALWETMQGRLGVISQLKGHRQWEKSTAAMDGEVVMVELAALLTPQHFWGLGLGLTHFGSKSARDWTGNAKWTWNPPVTSSGARGHQDYYPHWGLRDPSKQRSHTEAVIATSLWSFSHTLNNSMNRVSLWEENSTKLCRDELRNCTTTIHWDLEWLSQTSSPVSLQKGVQQH